MKYVEAQSKNRTTSQSIRVSHIKKDKGVLCGRKLSDDMEWVEIDRPRRICLVCKSIKESEE